MRQGRGGRAALIALAATALWGQESKLSVTWDGIEVRFVTRVEPPGENARKELPGLVITEADRVHHIITDSAHKRYFGYDLRLEPRGDGNSAQLRIEPLNLSHARADEFPIGPGWTLMAPPKYPVIPTLKMGGTVALDLLVNPATGQKVVVHSQLSRRDFGGCGVAVPGGPREVRGIAVSQWEARISEERRDGGGYIDVSRGIDGVPGAVRQRGCAGAGALQPLCGA